jgi:hypothetical protein
VSKEVVVSKRGISRRELDARLKRIRTLQGQLRREIRAALREARDRGGDREVARFTQAIIGKQAWADAE